MKKKDENHSAPISELPPWAQEYVIIRRQYGMLGFILLLMGATGIIATANQDSMDVVKIMFMGFAVFGMIAVPHAKRGLRFVMKHTGKHVDLFW